MGILLQLPKLTDTLAHVDVTVAPSCSNSLSSESLCPRVRLPQLRGLPWLYFNPQEVFTLTYKSGLPSSAALLIPSTAAQQISLRSLQITRPSASGVYPAPSACSDSPQMLT